MATSRYAYQVPALLGQGFRQIDQQNDSVQAY